MEGQSVCYGLKQGQWTYVHMDICAKSKLYYIMLRGKRPERLDLCLQHLPYGVN